MVMSGMCELGNCAKCWGAKELVLGLLILANVYYLNWDWWTFVGAVIALAGAVKLVYPKCPHCK